MNNGHEEALKAVFSVWVLAAVYSRLTVKGIGESEQKYREDDEERRHIRHNDVDHSDDVGKVPVDAEEFQEFVPEEQDGDS